MKYTLGIDIGTFETKGVLVDRTGALVATAARSHTMLVPQPGWAEHRPEEDWWGDVTFVTRELLAKSEIDPRAIAAVGCSAIGPCMLPVDHEGDALMNAVLYGVDTRAAQEIEELTQRIGNDRLLARCGNALTSQSVGPKILWLKRNRPEVFARTHRFLNSTSFVVHRLTDRFVIDHYSAAGFTPFYSAETLSWDMSLADDIIVSEQLPELMWVSDIAGTVTPRAAAQTGLAAGTPVIAGTIDAAAEALSVGVVAPGDMMVMYGSTIFIIMLTAERVRDARLWYGPWLFPGQHACMSGLATSGTLTHWFRDQFARDLDPATAHAAMAREAEASPPGAKGIIVLPYFSGERTPIHDPDAKGCIFGLDLTHTRADVYRGVLEGIAYGVNHIVETYLDVGQEPLSMRAVGGGTRNRVWLQAVSDVSGRSQILSSQTMGASFGDAFLAALAIGEVTLADLCHWNPVERRIDPEMSHAAMYERQFAIYKKLYVQTNSLMTALSGRR